ncbi:hypothetical protein [Hymenobacter cheonanensis]|uniref:hypothetical protein n=1 Tax=Hymenobacter sp. CA2-7 TaxID=3063993 RepID=UPI00272DC433|nr:hypothetical protein [Hymenobacter sp. CA2-7]
MATEATPNPTLITLQPAASYLPGTLGWVQQKLQTVQLQVRPTSSAHPLPALFYGFGAGSHCSAMLACLGQAPTGDYRRNYATHRAPTALVADRVYALFPQASREQHGMFDYLTEPARELVQGFIESAIAAFREALANDDDVAWLAFRVEFEPRKAA